MPRKARKIDKCEHTDRKHFAKGLCKHCYYKPYMTEWREKKQVVRSEYNKDYYSKHKYRILDMHKNWLRQNDEHVKDYALQYRIERKNNLDWRLKALVNAARKRSKDSGLDFDLDIEYIQSIFQPHCPILGIELDLNYADRNDRRLLPASMTLDRIDNTRGYVKGNVQIISWRANRLKSDSTAEERRLLYEHDVRMSAREPSLRSAI